MCLDTISIKPLDLSNAAIAARSETLLDRAFGIGRRTKTSYRFREREMPVPGLSFGLWMASSDAGSEDVLIAVISFWRLKIGQAGDDAIMLGPLAVEPLLQGKGLGRTLMAHALAEAARLGHRLVILVGDAPYYGPFGFVRVPDGRLILPGPVDPDRLLYLELVPGTFEGMSGLVLPPSRHAARCKSA